MSGTAPYGESTPSAPRVPREVALDFPRQWVTFLDPADSSHQISADLTWLCSHYACAFGTEACHGIDADMPWAGCCTHGAFLTDDDDLELVRRRVAHLTPEQWQHFDRNRFEDRDTDEEGRPADTDPADPDCPEPWMVLDELEGEDGEPEPALRTRRVDGVCIFHNRPGFAGGAGCALHLLALEDGTPLPESKPEVCWQVPLRRTQEWEERGDGEQILHTRITEYDRRAWGPGGADFDWYCTGCPSTHRASRPLWESSREELTALLGEAAYAELAALCRRAQGRLLQIHPAEPSSSSAAPECMP